MKTSCPHCGQHYDVEETDLGKEADCTNCGRHFVLQALAEPSEPGQVQPSARCPYCGGEISPGVQKCRHCGEWIDVSEKPQSPVAYIILAIFLGGAGIHNFFAGQKFSGAGKILLSLTWFRLICVFPHHWIGYSLLVLNVVWIVTDIVFFGQIKNVEKCLNHPQKVGILVGLSILLMVSLIYGEYYKLSVDSVEASYALAFSRDGNVTEAQARKRMESVMDLPLANVHEVSVAAKRGAREGRNRME